MSSESPNYERLLVRRFLALPFRHQIAIADSLGVLSGADRELGGVDFAARLFKRVASEGKLARLWEETERRHAVPADFNPWGTPG